MAASMEALSPLKVLLMFATLVVAAQCAVPTGFVLPAPAPYGLRSPAMIPGSKSSTLGRPATVLSAEKGGLGGFFSSISEKLVSTPDFSVKRTETIVEKKEAKEDKEGQAEKTVSLFNMFQKESSAKEKKEEMSSENTKNVETRAAAASKKKAEAVSSKEAVEQIRASVKSSRAALRGTATDERPGTQTGYQFTEEEIRARQERDAKAKQELEAKREKAKAKKDAEFAVRQELFGSQRQPLQPASKEGKRPGSTTTVRRLPEPKDPSLPWLERYLPAMWNAVPENQSMNPSFLIVGSDEEIRARQEEIRARQERDVKAKQELEAKMEKAKAKKDAEFAVRQELFGSQRQPLQPEEGKRPGSTTTVQRSKTQDTQAPPPVKLELPKAKLNALEVNKKQWMSN
jgi:hypothetical protein